MVGDLVVTEVRPRPRGRRGAGLTVAAVLVAVLATASPAAAEAVTVRPTVQGPVVVGSAFTLEVTWYPDGIGTDLADWLSVSVPSGLRYDRLSGLGTSCDGPTIGPGTRRCPVLIGGTSDPGPVRFLLHLTALAPVEGATIDVSLSSSVSRAEGSATVDVVDGSDGTDLYPELEPPGTVGLRSEVVVTGSVVNGGSLPAPEAVLTLELPELLQDVWARAGDTPCDVDGTVVTCSLGTVAGRARVPISLRAFTASSGRGAIVARSTSTATEPDPDPHPNEQLLPIEVLEGVDTSLTIVPASPRLGETLTLHARVTNEGALTAPVQVTFLVPDTFRIVEVQGRREGGGVTCSSVDRVVTCETDPAAPLPTGGEFLVDLHLEPLTPTPQTLFAEARSPGNGEPSPDLNPSGAAVGLVFPPSVVAGSLTAPAPDGTVVWAVPPGEAWPLAWASVSSEAATSASYRFQPLEPGPYQFLVVPPSSSGLQPRWVGGGAGRDTAGTFPVAGDGAAVELPAVELVASGAISGTVTDGVAGVAGVEVRAFGVGESWLPRAVATTAADGTYELPGLADGRYEVAFVPPAGSSAGRQWYDGSGSRSGAVPVEVVDGRTVASVDAVLVAPGSLSGTVTGPEGPLGVPVRVVAFADTDRRVGTAEVRTSDDGRYRVVLPPGSYRLRFVGPDGFGLDSAWLDGASSRWTSRLVEVGPGAAVTGLDQQL